MTTTQTTATYTKTQKGEWVVLAPAAALKAGATITVTKKDGTTKTETIESVGRAFERNGRQMAYGYPAKTKTTHRTHSAFCDECGSKATKGTRCWETGMMH